MANSSKGSTCPLFPELENMIATQSAVFTLPLSSTLPQGVGSGTMTTVANVQMDWGDVFYSSRDEELRKKYPALQQAWDHYHNILNMCKTREDEDNED